MKTKVAIHAELFDNPDQISLTGTRELKIEVGVEVVDDKPTAIVFFNGRKIKLIDDQRFVLKHRFIAEATKEMTPDILPIKIEYRGEVYRLRCTKAGKLVLNK